MVKKTQKNQYHLPFCAAMELELRENREQIVCQAEHNLNSKPNVIDFLVIQIEEHIKIKSGLGAIFRKYNLFEYKSPGDILNQKIYYRTIGYANLYLAYEKEAHSMEELTISFLREGKPVKLMKQFLEWGFTIKKFQPGIYHLTKPGHVDMQIIVIRQLGKEYKWITKLTDRVELQDMKNLAEEIQKLDDVQDRLNAESVFDLMTRLNSKKQWMKEMMAMGEFRDLFKEEFEKRDNKIAQLSRQLHSKDEELHSKDEENTRLKEENEQLKKLLGRIAMF